MNFWKYNIGDEITIRTSVLGATLTYQVVDRRIVFEFDKEMISPFNRSYLQYTLWNVEPSQLTRMDEYKVDQLVRQPSATIKRNNTDALKVTIKESDTDASKQNDENKSPVIKSDSVNHPKYYQGKIEVIDFIEDKGLGFNLGNCVKYISRAGKKNPEKRIEDLKKARWYLDREINKEG